MVTRPRVASFAAAVCMLVAPARADEFIYKHDGQIRIKPYPMDRRFEYRDSHQWP